MVVGGDDCEKINTKIDRTIVTKKWSPGKKMTIVIVET